MSIAETGGDYGAEGFVYQAHAPLPAFDGNYPVIGSWVVASQPAGIGIREDDTAITRDTSRFCLTSSSDRHGYHVHPAGDR